MYKDLFFLVLLVHRSLYKRKQLFTKQQNYNMLFTFLGFVTSTNKIVVIGLGYLSWFLWNFLLRLNDNFDAYDGLYREALDRLSDCKNNVLTSTQFINECKRTTAFLAQPKWWRTVVDTAKESGICGKTSCIDFLFGPDISVGTIFLQVIVLLAVIYMLLQISKALNRTYKKKPSQVVVSPFHFGPELTKSIPKDVVIK